jgi:DNA replication protein DnaC
MSGGADDALTIGRQMLKALSESPFACGACGEKILREGETCVTCARRAEDEERRQQEARRRLTTCGIPSRYEWATFASPELPSRVRDRRAVEAARRLASGMIIDRIVLSGDTGAGKTSLACCVLRALMDRGRRCRFTTAADLAVARAHASLGSEAPGVDRALDASVLLVDDLGENDPVTAHSAVGHVIHTRHAEERPTIVTTARTTDEIEAQYGSGIARRLYEGAELLEVATVLAGSPPTLRAVPRGR